MYFLGVFCMFFVFEGREKQVETPSREPNSKKKKKSISSSLEVA